MYTSFPLGSGHVGSMADNTAIRVNVVEVEETGKVVLSIDRWTYDGKTGEANFDCVGISGSFEQIAAIVAQAQNQIEDIIRQRNPEPPTLLDKILLGVHANEVSEV